MTTASDQFRPLPMAREILAHPERYRVGLVEWAREVVEESDSDNHGLRTARPSGQ